VWDEGGHVLVTVLFGDALVEIRPDCSINVTIGDGCPVVRPG
jgi:hypothetical protein